MNNKMFLQLNLYVRSIVTNQSPYTNVIGLSRTLLAIGTMFTLLLNPIHYFINQSTKGTYYNPLINVETFPINKFNFFLICGVENAIYMKWLGIIILLIVISGYFIKISSILHWWIAVSFMLSSSLLDGGDQIASILSFLLIPICLTDQRKNHWHKTILLPSPQNIIGILFIWLIRIQVAVIYFNAATGKFNTPEWENGTAMYYWLNHSVFGFADFFKPLLNPILSNIYLQPLLTYGVIILELCLFLALTASVKYRYRILPIAIFFHLFIIIFHGIFSFFFSIIAALLLYLLPAYKQINLLKWLDIK